ncbi:MAG TPA: hypothetical protein VMT89_02740, partial [Candidatus Acidoferrales bacterium]|nr:hypothetical protein [Candidatus Acidoferrales bacterium]
MNQSAVTRESFAARWLRRALIIPAYFLLWGATVVLLPVLVAVALTVDLTRRNRGAVTRCILFLTYYLCCEVVGIAVSFVAWVLWSPALGGRRDAFIDRNFRLEWWWARTLLAGAKRIFAMRIEAENAEVAKTGPFLLFIRHASVGDTLLPAELISST